MPELAQIAVTIAATILVGIGLWRLRARWDKAEPKVWTKVAEEALELAEADALQKDQAAKKAAAEAAAAHAQIAAFRARIGGPAA